MDKREIEESSIRRAGEYYTTEQLREFKKEFEAMILLAEKIVMKRDNLRADKKMMKRLKN